MKKAAKIVLLVVLLAMVGGIVYTVLTWPIYPQPEKNVDSYAQLREDLAQTCWRRRRIFCPGTM